MPESVKQAIADVKRHITSIYSERDKHGPFSAEVNRAESRFDRAVSLLLLEVQNTTWGDKEWKEWHD